MSYLEDLQERIDIDNDGDVTMSNQDFWWLYGQAEAAAAAEQEVSRLEDMMAYDFNKWLNACVYTVGKEAAYQIIANLSERNEDDEIQAG
ncbi:hypothetical protein [Salibacterium qingdaonense]|uniref:Uncharacterized protein n=1 Tax=Salibacterium qingdaonense TaxID=266892 RepID=A0A1I4Q569_9BACI|nr:hypothetical protein [Salibacterium qingdaonense]SFM35248.1 hypothetical protein SAMN04488054_1378 [Salibacterium qingdaonense]